MAPWVELHMDREVMNHIKDMYTQEGDLILRQQSASGCGQ